MNATAATKEVEIVVKTALFSNNWPVDSGSMGRGYATRDGVRLAYSGCAFGYGEFHLMVDENIVPYVCDRLMHDSRVVWYRVTPDESVPTRVVDHGCSVKFSESFLVSKHEIIRVYNQKVIHVYRQKDGDYIAVLTGGGVGGVYDSRTLATCVDQTELVDWLAKNYPDSRIEYPDFGSRN